MEGILPTLAPPLRLEIPALIPALGKKRGRVAFFLGCAMSLVFPEVSRQTARILSQQGFDVVTPREVKCCGAPHLAEGDRETARRLARINIDLFLALDVDFIVTDCAGCGCALKEYEETARRIRRIMNGSAVSGRRSATSPNSSRRWASGPKSSGRCR